MPWRVALNNHLPPSLRVNRQILILALMSLVLIIVQEV
jgi:hypothetical protein